MDQNEFTQFIHAIDENFDECDILFSYFDKSNDGQISLKEFKDAL